MAGTIVLTSMDFIYIGIVALLFVIYLVVSDAAGRDPLAFITHKKSVIENPDGTITVKIPPNIARPIEIDGRIFIPNQFELNNRDLDNDTWFGQLYLYAADGSYPMDIPLSRGELIAYDKDPFTLFASQGAYYSYRKGGINSIVQTQLDDALKSISEKDQRIAVLEAQIINMGKAQVVQDMKARRAAGAIDRNKYRKGFGMEAGNPADSLAGLIGGGVQDEGKGDMIG